MHCHGTLKYVKCFTFIISFSLLAVSQASAQQPPAGQQPNPADAGQNPNQNTNQNPNQAQAPRDLPPDTSQFRSNYVLGANDQILIRSVVSWGPRISGSRRIRSCSEVSSTDL